VTLPVGIGGLTDDGAAVVGHLLAAGVELTGVNAMTMNFGDPLAHASMSAATVQALTELHRQLGVLYGQVGIPLGDETLWQKIGATPMIGQNDLAGEVFTLDDAARLHTFAVEHDLGRLSMWSLNRDTTCGSNYAQPEVVSDACSGVTQGPATFAGVLGEGYAGDPANRAGDVTAPEPAEPLDQVDDPATSPYPVWSPTSSYPRATKIVWHRHVYVAKWWTTGDVPDDPVLNMWETPWTLVGPVMPGEHPVPPPTLPAGTFPEWNGSKVYVEGRRVLLDGVPYVARWWNQGESPQQSTSDPDSSPWEPMSADEIGEVRLHLGG
jgi:chitinase